MLVCLIVSLTSLFGCGNGSAPSTAEPALKPPTANVGNPYTGQAGMAVSFNGSASSDPQGQALSFAWSFGDGASGTGPNPTHVYAAAGSYPVSLTVTDTAGLPSLAATTTATMTPAADFSLNASPQSLSLAGGASTTLNVTAGALNGFSGPVTVTVSGLPGGVTQTSTSYALTPGVPGMVGLRAAAAVPSAITPFTVTATAGSLTHTAQVILTTGTAADYAITTSTPALSIVPGSTQMMTVTATAVNGFNGAVMGSLSGLPPGVSVSPASFALPLGTAVPVTVTAAAGLTAGNSVLTLLTSSSTATHTLPISVNVGSELHSIALSTPASLSVAPGGSAIFDAITYGVGGYQGPVNIQVSGLPAGVTASPSNYTVNLSPVGIGSGEVKLTGASSLGNGTASFTVTATAGTQTQQNAVVLTTAPTNVVAATINPAAPGTAFPPYFIGFSLPQTTLEEFTGTGTTTYPSFINLLANLGQYVGAPSIRSGLPSVTMTELGPLTNAATFTAGGVTTKPSYILGTSATYSPGEAAAGLAQAIAEVGSAQIQGVELDNEPDQYVVNGYRPANWTYTDWLTETAGYQTTFAPYLTAPQLVVSAESGRTWDPGIPALMTQLSGQISTFTAHVYALDSCNNNIPTIPQLMEDLSTARYFSRYSALVQTLSPVSVRVGEVNSVACGGFAGVSNTMAAALWVVDMAFESKAGGAAGFNFHSNGAVSTGPYPYDIGFSNNGSLSVYAPFYGVLFLAQAIQNGASPLPVAITQTAGNVKVWATLDAAGTLRVAVLEKDLDGPAQSKTVVLDLGSYQKPGTLTTLTAPSLSATSGITIGGQTFDGTTNGELTGPAVSSQIVPVNGVYTVTVTDGTAAMLTVAH